LRKALQMNSIPITNILFLDLETTGLDCAKHYILEVAILPAQLHEENFFCNKENLFTALLNFHVENFKENFDPKALEMHETNNLIQDILNSDIKKWELKELEQELIKQVNNTFGKYAMGIQLAGNSVHFDLQFIKHHMPTFAKRLSYRILDMSTFRTLATALCNYKSELNPAHRAKEDVLYSYSLMLDFIKKLRHSETNRSLN